MDLRPPGHRWKINHLISHILVICFLFSLFGAADAAKDPGKVKLAKLNRLTLRNGQMTTGRRENPVPQVGCLVPPLHILVYGIVGRGNAQVGRLRN